MIGRDDRVRRRAGHDGNPDVLERRRGEAARAAQRADNPATGPRPLERGVHLCAQARVGNAFEETFVGRLAQAGDATPVPEGNSKSPSNARSRVLLSNRSSIRPPWTFPTSSTPTPAWALDAGTDQLAHRAESPRRHAGRTGDRRRGAVPAVRGP